LINAAKACADDRNSRMIDNCWKHELDGRPYDSQVATAIMLDYPDADFEAWMFTAIRQADTKNTDIFRRCWPELWDEGYRRYHAPGGALPEDSEEVSRR
jgi:hypothetical protein